MLLASFGSLDRDVQFELMRLAVQQTKRVLPVLCQWELFDADGRVVGRTTRRLSQAEAERRFGLGEACPSGLPQSAL